MHFKVKTPIEFGKNSLLLGFLTIIQQNKKQKAKGEIGKLVYAIYHQYP